MSSKWPLHQKDEETTQLHVHLNWRSVGLVSLQLSRFYGLHCTSNLIQPYWRNGWKISRKLQSTIIRLQADRWAIAWYKQNMNSSHQLWDSFRYHTPSEKPIEVEPDADDAMEAITIDHQDYVNASTSGNSKPSATTGKNTTKRALIQPSVEHISKKVRMDQLTNQLDADIVQLFCVGGIPPIALLTLATRRMSQTISAAVPKCFLVATMLVWMLPSSWSCSLTGQSRLGLKSVTDQCPVLLRSWLMGTL